MKKRKDGKRNTKPKKKEVKEWCDQKQMAIPELLTKSQPPMNGNIYYGEFKPGGERKFIRCPTCNKRLKPKAHHCIGGEFVCWVYPKHKAK